MEALLEEIRIFLRERRWDRLRPSDIAKSISIEAAELLEIFQWDNMDIPRTKKDRFRMRKLREEIADVLIYTLYLPILLGLDPEKLIREKLAHNARKFPVKKMLKRKRTHSANDPYIRIKHRYRARRSSA